MTIPRREDFDGAQARSYASRCDDGNQARRLLSIAAIYDGMSWAAVVLTDRAGRHTTGELEMPKNITPVLLPSRAPELNPVENIWQFLRQTYLSNRVFEDDNEIVDAACQAWNRLIDTPWQISSIGLPDWAHNGTYQ